MNATRVNIYLQISEILLPKRLFYKVVENMSTCSELIYAHPKVQTI